MSTHPLNYLEPSDRSLLDIAFDRVDDSMLLEMARADYGDNGATIVLSQSLKSKNIIINAMCPGWVRTDMGGASATRSPEKGRIRQFG
jgi:hypothetical protein